MPRKDITSDRPIVLTVRASAICQTRLSSEPQRVLITAVMRTRLERSYRFEAAHFLPKVPPGHKCARMHGHSYSIDVAIEGEIDPERGWVMDFADIDEHVQPLMRQL